ncbi:retrovirus-related pol polyprotein from transposon TNT 1-94 [Tanacetum coccineum]
MILGMTKCALNFQGGDEEYAMAVRDFKKFFKRRGRFVRHPGTQKDLSKKTRREEKNEQKVKGRLLMRRSKIIFWRCPKATRDKNQGICWRFLERLAGRDDDKVPRRACLGFNSFEASSSGTKEIKFVKAQKKTSSDGEPKNVNEALTDESWIVAMQEELNQFIANDVWELVPQPRNMIIIGTKWVFRNKLDENGIVSRNKARLVAQGYNQQEGIDYDETYALVSRLESIRILLFYACALDFKLFQMDVKSAFLNDFINEEVYVAQPSGFIDFEKPDHVYKLKKALYGLKQAPKA